MRSVDGARLSAGVLSGTPDLAQPEGTAHVGIFEGERHGGKHGAMSKVGSSQLDFVADVDNRVPG